ncbi:TPA: recombinase RecT [Staphylococcus pseudintermedius]|nr:recombinase RecT [Staphylococcus pseudintermedius]
MANANSFKEQVSKNEVQETNSEKPKGPRQQVSDLLERMAPEIQKALPSHMSAERMARIAMTAISSNPQLLECNPRSLIGALLQASQIGLEPNTALGQAYLIPYYNNKKKEFEAQLQLSYLGLIELARRTGKYKAIYAHEVYKEDEFYYEYGLHKNLVHKPVDDPNGEPVGYYAVYHLQNGGFDFAYWTKNKIELHAGNYSKAVQKGWNSPWKTDFNAMAKKTVLKDLLKYAPKSIEISQAVGSDSKVTEINKQGEIIDITEYGQEALEG